MYVCVYVYLQLRDENFKDEEDLYGNAYTIRLAWRKSFANCRGVAHFQKIVCTVEDRSW